MLCLHRIHINIHNPTLLKSVNDVTYFNSYVINKIPKVLTFVGIEDSFTD